MLKGTIIHTARVQGDRFIDFAPFELTPPDPGVSRVEVTSSEQNVLSVRVQFAAVASPDTARVLARTIARRAFDLLAFRYSLHVEDDGPPAEMLVDRDFDGVSFTAARLVCTGYPATFRLGIGSPTVEEIRSELEGPLLPGEKYYPQFRTALQTADPLDRFMALYRLLLHLLPNDKGKEDQASVDAFIIREFGETTTPRPGKPNISETLYSRLRNEVGHVRPDVDLTATRAEIQKHVWQLAEIVKRAISLGLG
jgi:hypothetical protein